MSDLLPFRLPFPTAMYLTLYMLTLVVHVIFMNYVLAGSAYLAVASVFTGGSERREQKTPIALVLRDWMPFALGATITAGVAPLLFVQILYKKNFYTANLLLFHRWMSILPVLIVAFYLLYILKSRKIGRWPVALRALVGVGPFFCLAFTGYSWTANHLLSGEAGLWPEFYASNRIIYFLPELIARLAVWFFGAIPTCMVIVSWQLWYKQERGEHIPPQEPKRAAHLAIRGILLACLYAGAYYALPGRDPAIHDLMGPWNRPYWVLILLGLIAESVGWIAQLSIGRFSLPWLKLASVGVLATIVGATVLREERRLASVDIRALYDQHAAAAEVGGVWVFFLFLLVNAALIGWCVRLVRQGRKEESAGPSS